MDRLIFLSLFFIALSTVIVSQPQTNITADYNTGLSTRNGTFAAIAVDRNNNQVIVGAVTDYNSLPEACARAEEQCKLRGGYYPTVVLAWEGGGCAYIIFQNIFAGIYSWSLRETESVAKSEATTAYLNLTEGTASDIGAGVCNSGYISELKIHIRPSGGF
ncbi:MAG: DUF4189 domain-containing protein [Ignavibacteriales bacterium]|nr:DUF4189 domain-containing protein [Ignavibacteriales bacterium]